MSEMTVWYLDGDRFAVEVRDHVITVDQPLADGGQDTAPTPTEMFVASLAGCVAFYAHRFLARHHLPSAGLAVMTEYTDQPGRADADPSRCRRCGPHRRRAGDRRSGREGRAAAAERPPGQRPRRGGRPARRQRMGAGPGRPVAVDHRRDLR